MNPQTLAAAYAATCYRVYLPGGALDLRVGVAQPQLAAWLAAHGAGCFAVLTAYNPGSRLSAQTTAQAAADNAERQATLVGELLEGNYDVFCAENIADDGNWPVEESVFVPDLERLDALALAADYGQNAILWGAVRGVPELAWVAELDA
jgi:hypothetical protein